MQAVNLAVGIIAIILGIGSILLSLKLSNDAARSLDQSKNLLDDVRRQTEAITRTVDERVSDLINRAAPSMQDQLMGQFMSSIFSGQMDVSRLGDLAQLAERMNEAKASVTPQPSKS